MASSDGSFSLRAMKALKKELRSLKFQVASLTSQPPVNPSDAAEQNSSEENSSEQVPLGQNVPDQSLQPNDQRHRLSESVPLTFRLQKMKHFEPFVDVAALWIRSLETSVFLSSEPDYPFATSVLRYFIPDTFSSSVQQLIDNNVSWKGLKTAFVDNFTRQDPFVRLVDEVHSLRQGPSEPVGVFFERLTSILARGEMVDPSQGHKWLKLLVPIGLRPELLEGFRRHMDLPLKDIDRILTTEAYAKRAPGEPVTTTKPPSFNLTVTDNVTAPPIRTVVPDPDGKVNHVIQAVRHDSRDNQLSCFFCGKPGHVVADCYKKARLLELSDARKRSNRFHPFSRDDRAGNKRRSSKPNKSNKSNQPNKRSKRNKQHKNDDSSSDDSDSNDEEPTEKPKSTKGDKKAQQHSSAQVTVEEEAAPVDVGPSSNLLRMRLKIEGVWVNALLDTGATVSLFNTRVAAVKPDKSLFGGRVWINTAVKGMRSEAQGYAKLLVEIEGVSRKLEHKFLLITSSKEDVILGMDFILANNVVIYPGENRVVFRKAGSQPSGTSVKPVSPFATVETPVSAISVVSSAHGVVPSASTTLPTVSPTSSSADPKASLESAPKGEAITELVPKPSEESAEVLPASTSQQCPQPNSPEDVCETAAQPPDVSSKPAVLPPPDPSPRQAGEVRNASEAPTSTTTDGSSQPGRKSYHLFAACGTVIVPALTRTIDVCCKVPLQPGFYATRDNQSHQGRRTKVAEQIVEVTESSIVRLSVTIRNDTLFPVSIREGERLVTLEPISEVIVQTADSIAESITIDGEELPKLADLDVKQRAALLSVLDRHRKTLYREGQPLQATNLSKHRIQVKEGSSPVFVSQYPLPFIQQDAARQILLEMLRAKIAEPARSAYNSPIILVKKHDGTWRFVTDFRQLNAVTIPDRFPLARQDDIFRELQGMTYYTTIDLKQGFWQVEIEPGDRHFTAFSIPGLGQFQYCRLPFGLSNSPASFCRVVTTAISGCSNLFDGDVRTSVARAYVDDIIVASKDFESHVAHIDIVLQSLSLANLTIHPGKCSWAKKEIRFLGHIVDRSGIRIDPERIQRVATWTTPTNRRALLRFLGFVGFCRQFLPMFGAICDPLYKLSSNKTEFKWSPVHEKAFLHAKKLMSDPAKLAIPIYDGRPFHIECDACATGIGAALLQVQDDGTMRPIAYTGRGLRDSELSYGISEKECLAMVNALDQFKVFTEGHRVIVKTDHAALAWLKDKVRLGNRRLHMWALTLQTAFPDIHYSPGTTMTLADPLSRNDQVEDPEEFLASAAVPVSAPASLVSQTASVQAATEIMQPPQPRQLTTMPPPTDQAVPTLTEVQADFRDHQHKDGSLSELLQFLLHQKLPTDQGRKRALLQQAEHFHVRNGLLCRGSRLVVPHSWRERLLVQAHDSVFGGHLGQDKTLSRLCAFYWKGMSKDVRSFVQSCATCGRFKSAVPLGKPKLVSSLPEPYQPFSEVNMDVVTNLPKTRAGNVHILTITDKMSRWIEAYPLPNYTAATVASVFLKEYVCRFGAPSKVCSDQGSNFTSELFREVLSIINSQQQLSPAYCPWINGTVERSNGTVVRMLRNYVNQEQDDWDEKLPFVLFAYRAVACRATGFSPYRLVFGGEARGPVEASLQAPAHPKTQGHPTEASLYAKELKETLAKVWTHAKSTETKYRASDDVDDDVAPTPPSKPRHYSVGDRVFIYQPDCKNKSSKFAEDWVPNWVIRKVLSSSCVVVERAGGGGRNSVRTVHTAHIKPFVEREGVKPAVGELKRKAHSNATSGPSAKRRKVVYSQIDKIVDEVVDDAGTTLYRARWFGLTEADDTLEPESTFIMPGGAKSPLLLRWLKRNARGTAKS